jgi:hypothetical protein
MKRYAEGTSVPVEKTRAEIERLVRNHGATSFGTLSSPKGSRSLFEMRARRIRFELPIPELRDPNKRAAEERRRWRCLLLNVKAKFEAVENEIVSFDEEFLAHIVVPGTGETVGVWAAPRIAEAYERGLGMPPLLGAGAP